ncbi:Peptide synthetase OS=Lysinibacillus sphaericus OX=1421 GN=LS41612_02775 PE=3 SV=1 [Lysinibacillus sphaericus]
MEPSRLITAHNVTPLAMKTVLLTGATGYLGSHVLYELLMNTNAHVYCLMDKVHRQRLMKN